MTTQTDDWMAPGDDELGFGGLAKLKPTWKWALVIAVFSFVALAVSTSFHQDVVRRPVSSLRSNDAVIALRLGLHYSPSLKTATNTDSWIVLLDAQGQGTVASVDEVIGGDVLWSERGVFYGSPSQDYVTTDSGTQETAWQFTRRGDVQRYALPDGALVSVRRENNDYRIGTLFPDGTHASVETEGVGVGIGQCGGRIVAITTTEKSESIKSAAFEAYASQFGGGDMPEALMVVVQLTDHDGDTPPVLAVAPMIDGLSSRQRMFDCEGDVITMPSVREDEDDASSSGVESERRGLVLQRWDLSAGQRTIVPVVDEAGNPIDLDEGQGVSDYEAIRVGNEYRFVSWGGDAFAVDPASGQGRYLFSLDTPTYGPDGYLATFQVTETGVYALKDRRTDRVVTLSYRPWEGGEWRDIFTTRDLAYYLNEGYISSALDIQSFAVRPGWNGGAQ